MNNRAIKKLLSVVLVMALCVSTVFGCLITVNAADTDATYTITAESLHAYADEGKATITFNLASGGFTGGSFTLLKNDNITHSYEFVEDKDGNKFVPSPWDYEYNDVEIKVVGGVDVNGNAVSADQMDINLFYDTNGNGNNDIVEQENGTDAWSPNNSLWFDKPVEEGGTYKDAEGNQYEFVPGPDPNVADGTVFRHKDVKLADVSFSGDVAYQSITLEFDFEFSYCMQPNSQNMIRIANSTQKDQDGVAYADPVLTNGEGTEAKTLSENVIEGNVNYFHSHSSNNVKENGQLLHQNDYSIFTDKCKFCGVVSNQLISNELTSSQPNAYYDISALNVVYEDDGTVSLNLHCPGFQGTKEKLVISYADGKKTIYGDNKNGEIAGNSSFKVSPYAKEQKIDEQTGKITYSDNVLPFGTYMYEIKGLSAKDIGSKFYLTRVVEGSGDYAGGLFCGHTQEVSLSDYCSDVVKGDKVYYPAGTTDEQIAADKAVAVAFINYGVAAANALNNKVVSEEKEIVVTDTWDGTKVEPTETDYAGNIIINTAEELAWVALVGGANTANKNYKVAANQVFDMNGMTGITIDSTVANVKAAVKNNTYKWQTATDDKAAAFQGNFDGNGLVVYNLYSATGRGYSGLFPITTPATASTPQVIKNVAVCASHIGGYHYAGGIVGLAECNTTSSIVNFENCIVKNSYIYDNDDQNDTNRTVGAIVGGLSHNGSTLNNCAAFDNQISAQGVTGGLIGNKSEYGGSITIQNSISVGTSVLPTAGAKAVSNKFTSATYKNVYTNVETSVTGIKVLDTANMKGSAAATNMSALDWSGVWAITDSYPTFNPDILRTDVWDGTKVEPTATDAEGNIIISTAEELAWVILQGSSATQGKNYKVADGIKYFNMNGKQGININSTLAEVKAATENSTAYNWTDDSGLFKGNFDGNGVTIYNIYGKPGASYGGLFPYINSVNTTIKNVSVKASSFYGYHNAGGIIGYGNGLFTVNISNCAVENCYISDNNNTNPACRRVAAVFVGGSGNMTTNVSNCLAVGNECDAANIEGGILGNGSAYAPTPIVMSNNVVIGTSPYPVIVGSATLGADVSTRAQYSNNYTDQTVSQNGITTLAIAQMTGDAAKDNMALAWGAEWFEGKTGEYPSINGEVYADTWDGTFSEPTATDDKGNIIISTAEEMAWVALRGATATEGKSYKVADGMKYFNMNGANGITVDSTAADVKSATKTANNWRYAVDGKARDNAFRGNFDGNGVTIYNIYAVGYEHGALFPYIYNDSTIENVSVKASFLSGYHHAAGIVGVGELQKTININKCVVENCYITDNGSTNANCKRIASQFVGGTGNSNINISNCFAVNNTLSAAGIEAGFVGTSGDHIQKGISITDSISIGMTPYSNVKSGALGKGLTQQLTVLNIYSDVACDIAGVTTIDAADAKGAGADEAMPNLGWGIDWFTGKPGEYPCFVDDGVEYAPDEIEALLVANGYYSDYLANFANNYSRDSFTTSNENCDLYATGITLKTNPYMTVTFAFHDEYRANKQNVEAVIKVGDQTFTINATDMVNNEGAGRYHMVRLKDIKVSNLCENINVTLNYNGTQVGSGYFSVAGFAFTANDAGEGYEYYESAAQALVFYAEALQNKIAVTKWPQ